MFLFAPRRQVLLTGDLASVRFSFAFFGVDECYRDLSTIIPVPRVKGYEWLYKEPSQQPDTCIDENVRDNCETIEPDYCEWCWMRFQWHEHHGSGPEYHLFFTPQTIDELRTICDVSHTDSVVNHQHNWNDQTQHTPAKQPLLTRNLHDGITLKTSSMLSNHASPEQGYFRNQAWLLKNSFTRNSRK